MIFFCFLFSGNMLLEWFPWEKKPPSSSSSSSSASSFLSGKDAFGLLLKEKENHPLLCCSGIMLLEWFQGNPPSSVVPFSFFRENCFWSGFNGKRKTMICVFVFLFRENCFWSGFKGNFHFFRKTAFGLVSKGKERTKIFFLLLAFFQENCLWTGFKRERKTMRLFFFRVFSNTVFGVVSKGKGKMIFFVCVLSFVQESCLWTGFKGKRKER